MTRLYDDVNQPEQEGDKRRIVELQQRLSTARMLLLAT